MRPVFLIFFLVILMSCFNKGDCVITSTNLVKIALQKSVDGSVNSTRFLKVQEVHGPDTLTIYQNVTVSKMSLPLNPARDSTSFFFLTDNSRSFHLTLGYSTYNRIISTDCGAFLYYNNLKVKDSNFDSTRMINSQLLVSVGKNIQVYY